MERKIESAERIMDAAKKAVQAVLKTANHRHEALAAIRAAEAIIVSFPGYDSDPDVRD